MPATSAREARAPPPPLKQPDTPLSRRRCCCGLSGGCLAALVLVALALLAGEAAAFVYAWPRAPNLVKTELVVASLVVSADSTSPDGALGGGVVPVFAANGTVLASLHNPSLFQLLVTDADVTVFHPGGLGRTTVPVAQVGLAGGQPYLRGGGHTTLLRFALALNSTETPGYLHACAAALATRMPCVLLIRLTVSTAAGPIALPAVSSEWSTALTTHDGVAANDLFLSGR